MDEIKMDIIIQNFISIIPLFKKKLIETVASQALYFVLGRPKS